MLKYMLSILGLTALTALWMVFQLWLKKQDPQRDERCVGCGANCKRQDEKAAHSTEGPRQGPV